MTASDVVEPSVIGTSDALLDARQQTINGLRELADFLANNPELPIPAYGTTLQYYGSDMTKERLASIVRDTNRPWRKLYFGGSFELRAEFSGDVSYGLNTKREEVCERVVTGTKQVTVPAVEAQPERVEEVEEVEWVCSPLLAD